MRLKEFERLKFEVLPEAAAMQSKERHRLDSCRPNIGIKNQYAAVAIGSFPLTKIAYFWHSRLVVLLA